MVPLPKVIVIDNGALYCQAVRELLEPGEALVFVAQDVGSANVLLKFLRPDLLIFDPVTPGLDGVRFLRKLRQEPKCSSVPIIVTSAEQPGVDRDAALAAGANSFLSKPYSAGELRAVIETYLPQSKAEALAAMTA